MAPNNPPSRDAPRRIKPNNDVGRVEQVIYSPQIDALGYTGRPNRDLARLDQPLLQRALDPDARRVSNVIKIERWRTQAHRQTACQIRFATVRTAYDVNSTRRPLSDLTIHYCSRSRWPVRNGPDESRKKHDIGHFFRQADSAARSSVMASRPQRAPRRRQPVLLDPGPISRSRFEARRVPLYPPTRPPRFEDPPYRAQ